MEFQMSRTRRNKMQPNPGLPEEFFQLREVMCKWLSHLHRVLVHLLAQVSATTILRPGDLSTYLIEDDHRRGSKFCLFLPLSIRFSKLVFQLRLFLFLLGEGRI